MHHSAKPDFQSITLEKDRFQMSAPFFQNKDSSGLYV
jgi:hypothetical protein